jgi:putative transposase
MPGLPYHVTQRGSNRQRVFYSPTDYKMYLSLLRQQLADAQCRVLAYCLMTNHVHLVVVPGARGLPRRAIPEGARALFSVPEYAAASHRPFVAAALFFMPPGG